MTNKFTQKAQKALQAGMQVASLLGHTYIGSEHLLLGLCNDETSIAAKLLLTHGVDPRRVREAVVALAGEGARTVLSAADMTPRTRRIIERSATLSHGSGQSYIGTEHLLMALLTEGDSVAVRILSMMGISADDIRRDVKGVMDAAPGQGYAPEDMTASSSVSGNSRKREGSRDPQEPREAKEKGIKGAPTLSKFGRDLTAMAEAGRIDPIIGREGETDRLIRILSRRQKNNPCLIGEPGVGKTAVVEGLAQRIVDGNVPETVRERRVVTLDLAGMIAGAKYRGEFEERFKQVMEEVRKNPDIILFIDEIHTIIGAGAAEGAVDAANIIKPALARGEMQVIGATTIAEYRKYIEKDAALERRFQSVTVGEPTPEQAVRIMEGLRPKYEAHHKLRITDEAIRAAVELSVRYIPDRFLPDKAIDLMDEAAACLRIAAFTGQGELTELEQALAEALREKEEAILSQDFEAAARWRDAETKHKAALEEAKAHWSQKQDVTPPILTAEHIADVVTQQTGIPVSRLVEEDSQRLLGLEDALRQYVIGQDTAVQAVSGAIRRGRMGLSDPKRPMGSFIFLGPTGVGKTELSKGLARVLFGDEKALIRLDMSEYMEKHAVAGLIGSPPGYVGYEEGGRLVDAVRNRPYAVVLFDEIEKAHPDVFNILLQVLDDGVLTDTQGRRADFKNTVIIMTSNLGATAEERRALGFSAGGSAAANATAKQKEDRERMMTALKRTFRPEFINRIDDVIVFDPLGETELHRISEMLLEEVKQRVSGLGIELILDPSVTDLLASEGSDPAYGARPLRRALVRVVENPLSEELLEGRIKAGERVIATVADGRVIFHGKDS